MMQDRRGFFASIAGLFAVVVAQPPLDLGPGIYSSRRDKDLAMLAGKDPIGHQFSQFTQYMHLQLVEGLKGYSFPKVAPETTINLEFPHHFGIDLRLDEHTILNASDDQIREHYVSPMVHQLCSELHNMGVVAFAQLPLPSGTDACSRVTGSGVSLRGMRAYDFRGNKFQDPGFVHRFDVLFKGKA